MRAGTHPELVRPDAMNRLPIERRAGVIHSLVEGNSIRSAVRLTGVAKGTILRLVADVGMACAEYQHRVMRDLTCKRIQCDELWCFSRMKAKNIPAER